MNPTTTIVRGLIRMLLADIAPRWRAELQADPRVVGDPGLIAATSIGTAWLTELRRSRDAAIEADRLAEVLRRAFVSAAGRGRVCVPEDADQSPWIEVSPLDMALIETVREIAATLDAARGTAVAEASDAHRDDLLAQVFALAGRASEERRRQRRKAGW